MIIIGNWKMNTTTEALPAYLDTLLKESSFNPSLQVVLCPPAPFIARLRAHLSVLLTSPLKKQMFIGAQDCHWAPGGAYTGDISASIFKEIGCRYVILGHSERRQYHNETDELIQKKISAAHQAGLIVILCIGETLKEYQDHVTLKKLFHQLKVALPSSATPQNTLIAYEPIWAIGTGLTPRPLEVSSIFQEIQKFLQTEREQTYPLLYGGSVTAENAKNFTSAPLIDGLLVGGASLKAETFAQIISSSYCLKAIAESKFPNPSSPL